MISPRGVIRTQTIFSFLGPSFLLLEPLLANINIEAKGFKTNNVKGGRNYLISNINFKFIT